jgi:hypothetical protein
MLDTTHLLKITAAWISIVYAVCFLGVALFPEIREAFMYYGLHSATVFGENVATLTTFISGLALWNAIAFLSVGLFAVLFNKIKA